MPVLWKYPRVGIRVRKETRAKVQQEGQRDRSVPVDECVEEDDEEDQRARRIYVSIFEGIRQV